MPSRTNKPKNPANQFIYDHLLKLENNSKFVRSNHAGFIYKKVLKSLEKYPLPILSIEQVTSIEGVGDGIGAKIIKLVHEHYKDYLDPEYNRKRKKSYLANAALKPSSQKPMKLSLDDYLLKIEKERAEISVTASSAQPKVLKRIKPNIEYKGREKGEPKLFSMGSFILIGLLRLKKQTGLNFFTKNEIKSQYESENNFGANFSTQSISNLVKNGFIDKLNFAEGEKYATTRIKGTKAAERQFEIFESIFNTNKRKTKLQNLKNRWESNSQHTSKQSEWDEKDFTATKNVSRYKMVRKNFNCVDSNFCQEINSYKEQTFKIDEIREFNIILKVDNREHYKKTEEDNKFYERLVRQGINCELLSLPLGDFMWTAKIVDKELFEHELVTEFIIERKKLDDLASSLTDGRYIDQKNRLRSSGLKQVIFIIEGEQSGSGISLLALRAAIHRIRIFNKFQVIWTKNWAETLGVLRGINQRIVSKYTEELKNKGKIWFRSEYFTFSKMQSRMEKYNLGLAFGAMVRSFPGFGKESVQKVLNYFRTFNEFYNFLAHGNDDIQKMEFLDNLNVKQVKFIKEFFQLEKK